MNQKGQLKTYFIAQSMELLSQHLEQFQCDHLSLGKLINQQFSVHMTRYPSHPSVAPNIIKIPGEVLFLNHNESLERLALTSADSNLSQIEMKTNQNKGVQTKSSQDVNSMWVLGIKLGSLEEQALRIQLYHIIIMNINDNRGYLNILLLDSDVFT